MGRLDSAPQTQKLGGARDNERGGWTSHQHSSHFRQSSPRVNESDTLISKLIPTQLSQLDTPGHPQHIQQPYLAALVVRTFSLPSVNRPTGPRTHPISCCTAVTVPPPPQVTHSPGDRRDITSLCWTRSPDLSNPFNSRPGVAIQHTKKSSLTDRETGTRAKSSKQASQHGEPPSETPLAGHTHDRQGYHSPDIIRPLLLLLDLLSVPLLLLKATSTATTTTTTTPPPKTDKTTSNNLLDLPALISLPLLLRPVLRRRRR